MWNEAQEWESDWWGTCQNTFGEEYKQLLYAEKMGLVAFHDGRSPFNFDLNGTSVLDIGGGPVSLLLKCCNFKYGKVIDPLPLPAWVEERYLMAGIGYEREAGENVDEADWDEIWLYNVLQHTEDPARIIQNARAAGQIIRLFEWVDTPPNIGHPHTLTENKLNLWLGGEGKVEQLRGQNTCYGKCYYGIFPT